MNVLPFIIVMIALFASLSMSLFSHSRLLSFTEQSYAKFMHVDRAAREKGIAFMHNKLPKKADPRTKEKKQH